ncbi:hypothetical protein J3R30DRAFT_3405767 [Lentinula aciculospora]|uniref:Uncharacterized protein n=1 Tax=Lentinula aciculospora TaxID=153920 RepID=A0A9W9DL27_9AGAR|nr:hypothetical protein J3R30DRAFT_3405767 [Lentinula aciculospora]
MSTWPVNNHILPVIIMKPVQGEDILQSDCYKKAKEDEKRRLRKSFKDELRKTVLFNWTSNNVRVHTAAKWGIGKCKIESVTIVNWSYPNVFHVKPNQNMPNFDQWFDKRFKLSRPDIQA